MVIHWIRANDRPRTWQFLCSGCGGLVWFPEVKKGGGCGFKFCPWCGKPAEDGTKKLLHSDAKEERRK